MNVDVAFFFVSRRIVVEKEIKGGASGRKIVTISWESLLFYVFVGFSALFGVAGDRELLSNRAVGFARFEVVSFSYMVVASFCLSGKKA